MRGLVATWRLLRLAPHVLHGLWIVKRRFDLLPAAERHQLIQWWSAKTLRILGIELKVQGTALATGHLLVANHVSWLDIAGVHAVLPQARFVSKADVKHWPLVGALVEGVGTLFIERTSKRDALRVVHQTAAALQAGDCVAVFPEGTTGAGPELLPLPTCCRRRFPPARRCCPSCCAGTGLASASARPPASSATRRWRKAYGPSRRRADWA
jgi:1-acyl-sn-glycerol-3-phosphate acyltransferase